MARLAWSALALLLFRLPLACAAPEAAEKRSDYHRRAEEYVRSRTVAQWTQSLNSPAQNDRLEAVWALQWLGPRTEGVIPALIQALGNDVPWVRSEAIRALGRFGEAANATLPALRKAMEDSDTMVRVDAAEAVWTIAKDKSAIPVLIGALGDADPNRCVCAVDALRNIGPPARDAIPALIDVLKNRDVYVRVYAAGALSQISADTDRAVPALAEACRAKEKRMRRAAAESLGKIGPNAKAAIPALLRLLGDKHGVVRVAAAESLWRIARHPSAITSLVSELRRREDPNAVVEEAMAQLVVRPGAPTVQTEDFPDDLSVVQTAAADALARMGTEGKDAVAALLEISRDTDHPAHILAAVALWKIDNRYDPIPVLVAGLDNERYFTRFLAADSLEEIGPAARVAVPNLVEALRNFAAEAPTLAKRGVPEGPLLCDFGRINSRLSFEHARRAADRALRAIDPDAAAKAGIHTW